MTTVYSYYVGPTPGTLPATVNATILADLELSALGTYLSTVYNGGTQNIDVTFSAALNQVNEFILINITNIILYGSSPDNWFIPAPINTRETFRSTTIPKITNDYNDGYRAGSMVTTTTGDVYVCNDNTIGAAQWIKLSGGAIIPYYLGSNANISIAGNYFPLAFDITTVATLSGGIISPTVMNTTHYKAPRSGSIRGINASVALATLVGVSVGSTLNYTFTIFKASAPNGSTTVPTFSNVGSTVVSIVVPTVTLLTTLFNSNSTSLSVSVAQGDLIAVTVSVNTVISISVGTPALSLSAGVEIV